MHELVMELVNDAPRAPALVRMALVDGALVAGFDPGLGLRWLAKSGCGELACRRLRTEAHALGRLQSLPEDLGIPRLLGFRETGAGEAARACLTQTAVPGQPLRCRLGKRPGAGFSAPMRAALDWLRRFQMLDPLPPPRPSLGQLASDVVDRTRADVVRLPELQDLLGWIPSQLVLPGPDIGAITIHGDFWTGNVLAFSDHGWRAPLRVSVVDWSGLGFGSALDDPLTWFTQLPCSGPAPVVASWQRLFRPGRPSEFLREWAARANYTPAVARFAFYLYLAQRLRWELGLELQKRAPRHHELTRRYWTDILDWLAGGGYPNPFSSSAEAIAPSGLRKRKNKSR